MLGGAAGGPGRTAARARRRSPGPSREAQDLVLESDVVDLHVESFIWTRVFRYDLCARHDSTPLRGRLLAQADFPRLRAGGFTGAVLSIATNPFRRAARREGVATANLARLHAILDGDGDVEVVESASGYREARARGRLACFVGIQGGNAVAPDSVASLPRAVSRVTLVHLTRSALGDPSSPFEWLSPRRGLTAEGRRYVEALVGRRILVDLAHAGAPTFWDALDAHDRSQPPIVSHTGIRSVHPCWRNIDDSQVRAVADRGGVVGVMFHGPFLGEASAGAVVRHLERVISVGGEDAAALGSDWDGLILPPPELRSAEGLPMLVDAMLERGFGGERIAKVLGGNALRVLAAARP